MLILHTQQRRVSATISAATAEKVKRRQKKFHMKRSEGDKMQQIGTSKSHSTISWCTKEAICIERSLSCWWWHDKEHRHTAHNAHKPRRLSLPTVNCDVETKTQKYVEMYLITSKNGAFRHRHLVLRLINASIQTNSIPLEKENHKQREQQRSQT